MTVQYQFIICFLFLSIFGYSQSITDNMQPRVPPSSNQAEKSESDKAAADKNEYFNQGLFGINNSTLEKTGINPQTNIRSLRYRFYLGKDSTENNKAHLYIRHSVSNFAFELGRNTNVQKVAIESIGTEIINKYGGLFNISIGQKRDSLNAKTKNRRIFTWQGGVKMVTYNKSLFRPEENDKVTMLSVVNGFVEYDFVINLEKEGKKKKDKTNDYMAFNFSTGFAFSPIFNKDHIYYYIFQDSRGNPARNYNFLGSIELELKLDKIILTGGFIGRLPDANIFGLHPRWYFSISN